MAFICHDIRVLCVALTSLWISLPAASELVRWYGLEDGIHRLRLNRYAESCTVPGCAGKVRLAAQLV
jgi:hypothetical protein